LAVYENVREEPEVGASRIKNREFYAAEMVNDKVNAMY
jgi:hypothetical protein